MRLVFSFTPIYISVIDFKLTNSTSVSIKITECDECPFVEHFPNKVEPGFTADASVSRCLVAWCAFCSKYLSCLFSTLQAEKALEVCCFPAYTLKIGNEEVKVNACFGTDVPTKFYAEGDFSDYTVQLIYPPSIENHTMTCIAEVKWKR